MIWLQIAMSASAALIGGFAGGWLVAWRTGRWQQRVEDRLEQIEARLQRGDTHVNTVPVLQVRVDALIEQLGRIERLMEAIRAGFVTHEECDRRHGDGKS